METLSPVHSTDLIIHCPFITILYFEFYKIYVIIVVASILYMCTQLLCYLLRIPNGKRIWFWYETALAADASYLRIRKQYQNSVKSQQSGPMSHIVWTN